MTTSTVTISDKRITELSSLTYSKKHNFIVWGCNDDPKSPDVFGINYRTGAVMAEINIPDMLLNDTEAIDRTPDDKIIVGAIGDNDLSRNHISMFIFDEPSTLGLHEVFADPYRLMYPHGERYNAESLVVHPGSGDIYILTKQKNVCRIYKVPKPLTKYHSSKPVANVLFYVGSIPLSLVTDASFDLDGETLYVRQKGIKNSVAVVDWRTRVVLKPFKVAKVKQPEAIAVTPSGKEVVYGSEGRKSTLGITDIPEEYL